MHAELHGKIHSHRKTCWRHDNSWACQLLRVQCVRFFFNPQELQMKKIIFALALTAAAAAPALADQALATSKNCMACHAVDKKIVGPGFKDVAAKYKGDKAAADKLAAKIMKGGSGVWGAIPMPANPQVNDAEAKKLAAWVLSAK
jgi:cytochrome c